MRNCETSGSSHLSEARSGRGVPLIPDALTNASIVVRPHEGLVILPLKEQCEIACNHGLRDRLGT